MDEETHKAKSRARSKDWRLKNPERAKELSRISYARNRDQRLQWVNEHRPQRQTQQRDRYKQNKINWFTLQGNKCAYCGVSDSQSNPLEVDHIDPASKDPRLKRRGGAIWHWPIEQQLVELAKCQLLCHNCHTQKTLNNKEYSYGDRNGRAKLIEKQVVEIINLLQTGLSQTEIARLYNVQHTTIYKIAHNLRWKHIPRPS